MINIIETLKERKKIYRRRAEKALIRCGLAIDGSSDESNNFSLWNNYCGRIDAINEVIRLLRKEAQADD